MSGEDNSLTITHARVVGGGGIIEDGSVIVSGGRIAFVGSVETERDAEGRVVDARGYFVGPGFIDLHVHGAGGANFLDADEEAVRKVVATHARYGTTGLLATLATASMESLQTAVVCISNMIAGGRDEGILGIHLEGPYLNPERSGAQPPDKIRIPDRSEMLNLLDLAGAPLKIMTLAPEMEGGLELVRVLKGRGIIPAAGHSDASAAEAGRAFAAGIRYVTHLFNAMSEVRHRQPGLAAAALMEKNLFVELIVDGIHVDPMMVRLAVQLKGEDDIVAVTDCMEALDADSVEFRMSGRKVTVRDGVPRLDDGVLCGTTLTMNRAVGNLQSFTGAPIEDVVKLGSLNPARVLGLEDRKGSIDEGKDADLVIFDDEFDVKATIIGGKIVFSEL